MRSVRTISREVVLYGLTPQRPYARAFGEGSGSKRWSVLHGDMQRPAEMTGPLSYPLSRLRWCTLRKPEE
jgi:hypothetical protein